jgi:hypothetical protein
MTHDRIRLALLGAIAAALLVACDHNKDEKELKPVEITPGIAVAQPTTGTDPAIEPAVAYDGTRVHLVYSQNNGAGRHDLMYVARVGAGPFSNPAPVFPASASDSRNTDVHLDANGTLHIVWEEGTSPNRDIWYATINASGSISTASNLSTTVDQDEANPRVHVDGNGRVHVVWEGSTPPPTPTTSIFYRRTQGSIFLATVTLPKAPNSNQPAQMPDIATDAGGRIYAVWAEQNGPSRDIRMVRSDDGGMNFGTSQGQDFVVRGTVDMTSPRIVGGKDGEVFLCFVGQDTQGERAVYATYTRTGFSMAQPGQLASSKAGGLREPAIAAYKRNSGEHTVMIAWNDGTAAGGNIVVHASHDSGANYPKSPTNLSQGNTQPATNRRPAIAMDNNELVTAWEGQPQGGGVLKTWTSTSTYKLP